MRKFHMANGNTHKSISQSMVDSMKVMGKPPCPYCGTPLAFVYEGTYGCTNQKCIRCGKASLLSFDEMKAYKIDNTG